MQSGLTVHAEVRDEIGLTSGSLKKKENSQKKRKQKLEMEEQVKLGKGDEPEKEAIADQESPELETKVSIRKENISAAANASEEEERKQDEFSLDRVSNEDQRSVKKEKSHCPERCESNGNLKGNFKLRIKLFEKKVPKAQKSGDVKERETLESVEEQAEISLSTMQIPIETVKQISLVCGKKDRKEDGLQNCKKDVLDNVVYEEIEDSSQLDNNPVQLENVLKRTSKKRKLSKEERRKKKRDQHDLEHLSVRTECGEAQKNLKCGTELTNELHGTSILIGNDKIKAERKRKLKKKESVRSVITVSPRTDIQTEENHETVESNTQEGRNDTHCLGFGENSRKEKKKKKKKKKKKLKTHQQEGCLSGLEGLEDLQQNSLKLENMKMHQNIDNKNFLSNADPREKVLKEKKPKITSPASTEVNLDVGVCENGLEQEDICKNSNQKSLETENCILGESKNCSERSSLESNRSKKKKHKNKGKQETTAIDSAEKSFSGLVGLSDVQQNSLELENPGMQHSIEDNENLLTNTGPNRKVVKGKKLKNISPASIEVDLSVCENGLRQESICKNSNHKNLETKDCIFKESRNSSGKSLQRKNRSKRKKHKVEEKQETAAISLEFNKKEIEQVKPVLATECQEDYFQSDGAIDKNLQVKTRRKRFNSCSSIEDFQTTKKRKRRSEKLSFRKDLLKDFNGVDVTALHQEKKEKENKEDGLQTNSEKEENPQLKNVTGKTTS